MITPPPCESRILRFNGSLSDSVCCTDEGNDDRCKQHTCCGRSAVCFWLLSLLHSIHTPVVLVEFNAEVVVPRCLLSLQLENACIIQIACELRARHVAQEAMTTTMCLRELLSDSTVIA